MTLGQSFPLPGPQVSEEKHIVLREPEAIWQRTKGVSCPQNPSQPDLSGCSGLMGTNQSPEPRQPNRKAASGSGRACWTEITRGHDRARGGQQEGPSLGLGTCKASGKAGPHAQKGICCQARRPGRSQSRLGHQETGLLSSRSERGDAMLARPERPQRIFRSPGRSQD